MSPGFGVSRMGITAIYFAKIFIAEEVLPNSEQTLQIRKWPKLMIHSEFTFV